MVIKLACIRTRRWDGCFIRLLDGMLQAGALDIAAAEYQLRIPTKIRHLAVAAPGPALPPGSEGARWHTA
jgi:fatty acid synthase